MRFSPVSRFSAIPCIKSVSSLSACVQRDPVHTVGQKILSLVIGHDFIDPKKDSFAVLKNSLPPMSVFNNQTVFEIQIQKTG